MSLHLLQVLSLDIFIRDQRIASISKLKIEIKMKVKNLTRLPRHIEKASHDIHKSVAEFK